MPYRLLRTRWEAVALIGYLVDERLRKCLLLRNE